ncbi:UbiA family prenyltransferase [Rhodanobacter sp. AS-Z3]|uniref:UbiA prenyltransferase family protein n=1 Tax=Rhodanobacter sp. AS-Z3 TaxID=3031330 RepID=UPI0024799459|nr:UbiA family prenyltransferase [Rhodanobacter sp. AS-Z3]WEN15830.1 UbiA family prenyltransferase [Rhodanobacter sp. AS-Z3]
MRRFLALSRSAHGMLDVALPGFAALLWLGSFPAWPVLLLSLATAAAGYTAIYALNDLLGVKTDQEKFAGAGINSGYSVEASQLRYPLAQKLLSMRSALAWFGCWYVLALVGAYLLNPPLVIIVLAAAVLEVAYCQLLKVTYWRTLVSGLVKSCGPLAAVFVVQHDPSLPLLGVMLAWIVLWEIGGQNIPADWNDIEEDRRVGARTIPLAIGTRASGYLVLITLGLSVLASLWLPLMSPRPLGLAYLLPSALAGGFLLLWPAWRLHCSSDSRDAAALFDRASYYPLVQLALITVFVIVQRPG